VGFDLRKLLEAGVAQANPFDGGKTASTVMRNVKPTPPPASTAQPVSNVVNQVGRAGAGFGNYIANNAITKALIDTGINTASLTPDAIRLGSAGVTGNKQAMVNAQRDWNKNYRGSMINPIVTSGENLGKISIGGNAMALDALARGGAAIGVPGARNLSNSLQAPIHQGFESIPYVKQAADMRRSGTPLNSPEIARTVVGGTLNDAANVESVIPMGRGVVTGLQGSGNIVKGLLGAAREQAVQNLVPSIGIGTSQAIQDPNNKTPWDIAKNAAINSATQEAIGTTIGTLAYGAGRGGRAVIKPTTRLVQSAGSSFKNNVLANQSGHVNFNSPIDKQGAINEAQAQIQDLNSQIAGHQASLEQAKIEIAQNPMLTGSQKDAQLRAIQEQANQAVNATKQELAGWNDHLNQLGGSPIIQEARPMGVPVDTRMPYDAVPTQPTMTQKVVNGAKAVAEPFTGAPIEPKPGVLGQARAILGNERGSSDLFTNVPGGKKPFETLPADIHPALEGKAVGVKRIAPDRVPHQKLTPQEGIAGVVDAEKAKYTKRAEGWAGIAKDTDALIKKYGDTMPARTEANLAKYPDLKKDLETYQFLKKNTYGSTRTLSSMRDQFVSNSERTGWTPARESATKASADKIYRELVKKDISKGYRYPDEVLNYDKSFKTAVDSRARYEKGLATSFSSDDSRIVFDEKNRIAGGMKRQDGKELTPQQKEEMVNGILQTQHHLGINIDQLSKDNRWVFAHLNGKNPFLTKNAAGLYRGGKDHASVSVGGTETFNTVIDGKKVSKRVNTTMAHELGHALDLSGDKRLFDRNSLWQLRNKYNKVEGGFRGSSYWNSDSEMTARAIAQYVDVAEGNVDAFTKPGNWSKELFDQYIKPTVEKGIAEKYPQYKITGDSGYTPNIAEAPKFNDASLIAKEKAQAPVMDAKNALEAKRQDQVLNAQPTGEPALFDRNAVVKSGGQQDLLSAKPIVGTPISKIPKDVQEVITATNDMIKSGDLDTARAMAGSLPPQHAKSLIKAIDAQQAKYEQDILNEIGYSAPVSHTVDSPDAIIQGVAKKLGDHFNAPGAVRKITGAKRTYTTPSGTLSVGGDMTSALDNLIFKTDIHGFKKNMQIMAEKFGGVFKEIADSQYDDADYNLLLGELNAKIAKRPKYAPSVNAGSGKVAQGGIIGESTAKKVSNGIVGDATPQRSTPPVAPKPIVGTPVGKNVPKPTKNPLDQVFYKGFKKDGTSTGSGQGDAFYITPHEHIAKTYDEGVGVKQYKFAKGSKSIDVNSPEYKAVEAKHMVQKDGKYYREPDYNAINKELVGKGYHAVTSINPDGSMPQVAVLDRSKLVEAPQPTVAPATAKLPTQTSPIVGTPIPKKGVPVGDPYVNINGKPYPAPKPRMADTPAQATKAADGLNERGFSKSIRSEEDQVATFVADNIPGYKPITNKAIAKKAAAEIAKDPSAAYARIVTKEQLNSAEDIATGNLLLHKYIEDGDIETAIELGHKLGVDGTKLGQAIQAYTLWKKTTPEGILREATKQAFKANKTLDPVVAKDLVDRATKIAEMPEGLDKAKAIRVMLGETEKLGRTWKNVAEEIFNIPRALMATMDFSAPLRQGAVLGSRYPKQFGKAFVEMFKYFGKPAYYEQAMYDVTQKPTYGLMKAHGLAVDGAQQLTGTEEQFLNSMLESDTAKKFGIGHIIAASDRAYSGFLTKLRADVFEKTMKDFNDSGIQLNKKELDSLTKFINSASGRGQGKVTDQVSRLQVLFSARLWKSRLDNLNPLYYARLDPVARKLAVQSTASFAGITGSLLGLAALSGMDVETDPRSADFAKIKVDNTRFDILGGHQQNIRLLAQMATGTKINSVTGEVQTLGADRGFGKPSRLDLMYQFLENKENPIIGFATKALRGTDQVGNPINLVSEAGKLAIPLTMQSTYDTIKDTGSITQGIAMNVPGIFGVGTQTYGQTATKDKATADINGLTKAAAQADANGTRPKNGASAKSMTDAEKKKANALAVEAGTRLGGTDTLDKAQTRIDNAKKNISEKLDPAQAKVIVNYAKLDDKGKEKFKTNPKNTYGLHLAQYENDVAGGKLTDVDKYQKEKTLAKEKITSDYSNEVVDFYSMSKEAQNAYFARDRAKATALYNEAKKLDSALVNSKLIASSKYKYGLGTKGKGSKGSKSADYSARLASTNKLGLSTTSALRKLVKASTIKRKAIKATK